MCVSDQQLCKKEESFGLDHKDLETPQIKEEPCSAQEERAQRESDTFTLSPVGENDYLEDQSLDGNLCETVAEKDQTGSKVSYMCMVACEGINPL